MFGILIERTQTGSSHNRKGVAPVSGYREFCGDSLGGAQKQFKACFNNFDDPRAGALAWVKPSHLSFSTLLALRYFLILFYPERWGGIMRIEKIIIFTC